MQRDYKQIALSDLRAYPARKAALRNLQDKISTLQHRFDGLDGASADAVPVQGGGNRQEDSMIDNIVERERLRLNYEVDKTVVKIMERGLAVLSEDERRIVLAFAEAQRGGERYVADRLAAEMNMDRSTIYRIRNDALRQYTIACYGVTDL